MARKKKHPEHANHERWLVSYADFITLLFAFFVVMFSASQVDKRKVGKLARAVQIAFQELGVFQATGTTQPLQDAGSVPNDVQLLESFERTTNFSQLVPAIDGSRRPEEEAEEIKQHMQALMARDDGDPPGSESPAPASYPIEFRVDHRGLIISLAETAFFDSGSAVVRSESYPILDKVARALLALPNYIRVEGHTDNQPIKAGPFPSNWELSTARATFISNYLIKKFKYPPRKLAIAGYAEYHPVASNATAAGRAQNRRVDIVVLSDKSAQQEEPQGSWESGPAARSGSRDEGEARR